MSFQVTDSLPVCGEETEARRQSLFRSHPGKWGGGSTPDPAPNSHGFKVTCVGWGWARDTGCHGVVQATHSGWKLGKRNECSDQSCCGYQEPQEEGPHMALHSPLGVDSVATGSAFPPHPPETSSWISTGSANPFGHQAGPCRSRGADWNTCRCPWFQLPGRHLGPKRGSPCPPGLCPDGRTCRTQVSVRTARPTLTHTCVNSASWSPAKPGVYSVCGWFPPQLQVRVITWIIWPEAIKIYYRAHAIASVIK